MIKSLLRYPGGKSRFVNLICPLLGEFNEYREPFAGGASVFFGLFNKFGNKKKYSINDSFHDLYCFYNSLKYDSDGMIEIITDMKKHFSDGKLLYKYIKDRQKESNSQIEIGSMFFIINRITFSGVSYCGGYSQQAFEKRFTDSSIERLKEASKTLKNVEITNTDYSCHLLIENNICPQKTVIYLDPPYALEKKSMKLYGNHGDRHKHFDFERFAENVNRCKFRCLISLNDTEEVRQLFKDFIIVPFEKYHSMKYGGTGNHKIGKELLIANYDLPL